MTSLRMKSAIFAAALALLSSNALAWTTPMKTASVARTTFSNTARFMAEDESETDKVQLTSGKKEIMFDDKSGRFFETNLDAEECIPDEEFCTIDESTGKKLRLTVAEKERIFLDSLQVGIII